MSSPLPNRKTKVTKLLAKHSFRNQSDSSQCNYFT